MPGHPREMITTAERRFPVRIRIGIPPGGFGRHHAQMTVWLDENCGAVVCLSAIVPRGLRQLVRSARRPRPL